MKYASALFCILYLAGCNVPSRTYRYQSDPNFVATTGDTPRTTYPQLLQRFGPPTSTYPDGQGGQILTYAQRISSGQITVVLSRLYYVNAQGIVYHYNVTKSFQ